MPDFDLTPEQEAVFKQYSANMKIKISAKTGTVSITINPVPGLPPLGPKCHDLLEAFKKITMGKYSEVVVEERTADYFIKPAAPKLPEQAKGKVEEGASDAGSGPGGKTSQTEGQKERLKDKKRRNPFFKGRRYK